MMLAPMLRTTLLSITLLAACGNKKQDDKAAPAAAAKTTENAGGPVKTDPKALFADFAPDSKVSGMDLLNKYHDGATFSGVIKTAPGDMAPTSAIMDVDGKNHIMLELKEAPKAMKAGDTVTVTCKIDGESGTMMQASECVLAK